MHILQLILARCMFLLMCVVKLYVQCLSDILCVLESIFVTAVLCIHIFLCIFIASSLGAMKDLVAESTIMKTFHHPNVLPLLGVCIDYDDEDVLKVVMPFMSNGDLRNFLKNNRVSPNNIKEYPKVHM